MVEKFEVGKKYEYRGVPSSETFVVKYVGMYRSFVQFSDGMECAIYSSDAANCDEYHEPKVEKFVKFVMRYMDKAPFTADRRFFDNTQLGKIEITLTDGKLSSVNIVEGE